MCNPRHHRLHKYPQHTPGLCVFISSWCNNHALRCRHSRQSTTYDIQVVTNYGPEFPLLCKLYRIGQLIFRKIIKIVDGRCQILWLKCTKFDFGWGCAPDSAGGAYSAHPDPLAGLRGPTSKGRKGKERKEGRWEKGLSLIHI